MSGIDQKSLSSDTGKPRRLTANWIFDNTSADYLHCSKSSAKSKTMTERESRTMTERESRHKRGNRGWSHLPPFQGESSSKQLPQSIDGAETYHHTVHCGTISSSGPNNHEEPSSAEDSFNDCMSDGTDSGLGSGTTLSVNQEVLEYLADSLIHLMNPTLVLPHLMNYGLLNEDDADFINSPKTSDELRKQRILTALAVQDGDIVDRLVDCLSNDMVYSNHRYIARRLREAMDKKRRHPDMPLSTLRLGTPPQDSKEVSPPITPIRPRGAAQRNSIAKLLATKRNNVAHLISQIETKESSHQQQDSVGPTQLSELQHKKQETVETSPNRRTVQNETRISSSPHKVLPVVPSTVSPSLSNDSGHHTFSPHTPLPTSPLSHNHPVTLPSLPTHLYSPTQPPSHFSYPQPTPHTPLTSHPVTSPAPTSPHTYSSHPHYYHPTSPSPASPTPQPSKEGHPITSPHLTSPYPRSPNPHYQASSPPPPLPLSPPPHSVTSPPPLTPPRSIQDKQSNSHETSDRTLPTPYIQSTTQRGETPVGRRIAQEVQRNSLPDILDSPTAYPSSTTEETSDDRGAVSPDALSPRDMVPVHHRQRPARHLGFTARFYGHRRSASMSAYDTRSFKRGDHHYASDNWGKLERSGYRQTGQGREDDDGTSKVRASVREGAEKLVKRRIDWLQERVQFTHCPEHIQFISHTHYGQERELLYSGTLNKHGKPRFVVLFSDYLLVLKAKRPSVPSKLGGVFNFQQSSSRIDWFSDLEYTTRKPLPLHLLTVQHQRTKQSNDTFCLHFNEQNKVMEIVLQAVSKEARDIWVEELSEAITETTSAHADSFVLVGNRSQVKRSGEPYKRLQLQIHSASSLGLAANCNSFSLFCVIELGKQRCRTPSVMGGYNPSWDYKCEFTDFDDEDSLLIEIFSENIFRPNDFLGCLNVPLSSLPVEQPGRKKFDGNMVLAGLEEAFAGEIHINVEQGWETKM